MLKLLHPIAGAVAFLTILSFWFATVVSEVFGSIDMIVAVKQTIPWGLLILVPALATTGASGFRVAGESSDLRIKAKRQRMQGIAANGVLVLIPCMFALKSLATQHEFGVLFIGLQSLELIAGAFNLTLMAFNIRDGLRLRGH